MVNRRRVQNADHLDETETNEMVNRMFQNPEKDETSMYRPWETIWQCSMVPSPSVLQEIGDVNIVANSPRSFKPMARLGSLYGSSFSKDDILDGASQAGSTPTLSRIRKN